MPNTTVVEHILDKANIKHRTLALTGGCMFFCETTNGMTFDAFLYADGTLRLWRFVLDNLPLSIRGRCFKSSISNNRSAAIRLEVTDEGYLNLAAEQKLSKGPHTAKQIEKQMMGFISLITKTDFHPIIKPLAISKETKA